MLFVAYWTIVLQQERIEDFQRKGHIRKSKMAALATELRGKGFNHICEGFNHNFEFGLPETRQRLEIKGVEHHF